MKLRRAAGLIATLEDGHIVLQNYLERTRLTCSAECLEFLAALDAWHTAEKLFTFFPDTDRMSLAQQFSELVTAKVLVVKGTAEAALDEKYRKSWEWGGSAGFFHFSIRETRFITGKSARAFVRTRRAWKKSPVLTQSNRGALQVIKLPKTDLTIDPFRLMRLRRSRRRFTNDVISMNVLADCLFSGNGVVEFYEDADFGRLPISMTPSGGARNPFELYAYTQRVQGLKPGFYHYDAVRHDLGLLHAGEADIRAMLGGQRWPAKAAAVIFLVAHFPRTMWKYHMPIAYRVIMMEAGFIGQNIALAATHYGLSAIPSGALNEPRIESQLGTPLIESAVVLSLSLGKPKTGLA